MFLLATAPAFATSAEAPLQKTSSPNVTASANTREPDSAILWLGGMTRARADYEIAVVEMALEKSRSHYGDYRFTINGDQITSERLERDIARGETINLLSQPVWSADLEDGSITHVIPRPISKGLLGYRQLVVRRDSLDDFAKVHTLADLQTFTAGAGIDWVDSEILDKAELPWNGGSSVDQLYSMLERGRFDYLPLGALEVEATLAALPDRDKFAVVPGLVLYYPLPVYLQTSINTPRLAQRLAQGLKQMVNDGSLNTLFEQHYGKIVKALRAENPRIIRLKNPHLPSFAKDRGPTLLQ